MRLIIQRVNEAQVWIDRTLFSSSGRGLLVLIGCRKGDQVASATALVEKLLHLRIFEDDQAKMNLSVSDIGGELMIVSQFTLYADTSKGRRPAFTDAMEPIEAEQLYEQFVALCRASGLKVSTGSFGAKMDVQLINHGPVTIVLEHDVSVSR